MGMGSAILPTLIWNWGLVRLVRTYKPGRIGGILGYLVAFTVPIAIAFVLGTSQPKIANFVALEHRPFNLQHIRRP